MGKILIIDHTKCTGCKRCEIYCSLTKTGTCNPARSRIRVISWEEEGINIPTTCLQCQEPLCMMVCPVAAIKRNEETGILSIDAELCIGCKMCLMVCPFGAPFIDMAEDGKAFICDQCLGEPVCVRACPTEALQYIEADKLGWLQRRVGLKKLTQVIDRVLPIQP